jgi:hypothetical protein
MKVNNSDFIAVLHLTVTVTRVFKKENNSYPKLGVKRSLTCSRVVLVTSVDEGYILASLFRFCVFGGYNLISHILQIPSSLYPTPHYEVTQTTTCFNIR